VTDIGEKMVKAGFDHPCKETCSGWKQGYDRGAFELAIWKDLADRMAEWMKRNGYFPDITAGEFNAWLADYNHAKGAGSGEK
jgi:hypothetical protein